MSYNYYEKQIILEIIIVVGFAVEIKKNTLKTTYIKHGYTGVVKVFLFPIWKDMPGI